MIRIGLVGEDPNDTTSIKNLLLKKYGKRVIFHSLVPRIKGYYLDNPKIRKALPIEFKDKKCKFVIYIRDLDGFKSETSKINARQKWFKELDATITSNGILLLNIWEIEALIFADIKTFNLMYGSKHKFAGDPMAIKEPKEELMRITSKLNKKYKESHSADIFLKLDLDTVIKRCTYFKYFITEFEERI